MVQVIRYITWIITRIVIPLRYRIVLKGWPPSVPLKPPVLLLPNHPGLIDPVRDCQNAWGLGEHVQCRPNRQAA